MRDKTLIQLRDYELFCAYKNAITHHTFVDNKDAIDFVRKSPAPKWFVSKEFAAAVLSTMMRNKSQYKMRDIKQKKFSDMLVVYRELRQKQPFAHMNHLELCEYIVDTPAPEWYLSYITATSIIKKQIKICHEEFVRKYVTKY